MGVFLFLFLDLALATWVAWLADRRGRSFWMYLVFSLVLPGTALIVIPYLLVFTRKTPATTNAPPGVEA